MYEEDPLWKLRHALVGLGLALLLSIPIAAGLGVLVGGWLGDTYAARAGVYAVMLVYVVAGAVVLFTKVARHETRPLGPKRLALWLASLWMWPALLLAGRGRKG